jgi:tetratricopeptide (TPR) repeat protein
MLFHKFFLFILLPISILYARIDDSPSRILDSLQLNIQKVSSVKDSAGLALAYYDLGRYYDNEEKYDECKKHLLLAAEIAESAKEIKTAGRIYNYLASVYSQTGEREKSIIYYEKSYKYFEKLGIAKKMAAVLLNIGSEYVIMGDLKKAIEYEIKAIKLKEVSKDSTELVFYYLSLADLFFTSKDFRKWEIYLLAAQKLAETPAYTSFTSNAKLLNELGEYYRRNGNLKKAIQTFEKLYQICEKEDYINGMATASSNLSQIYTSKGDYKKAELTTRKALELNRNVERVSGIISNLNQLGSLNRVLKNYTAAKGFLLEAIKLAIKYRNNDELTTSYDELYQVNKSLGNYPEALKSLELYNIQKDSLLNLETSKQIAELEGKYQSEKKEVKIKLLQKENELAKIKLTRQNVIIISILIFAILLASIGYMLYRQKKTSAEITAIQAEHKMLRSQMNPHFIFNSLMAIQNYLFKNDAAKTADYLSDFASLMRLILAGSRADKISVEEEIKITENYLSLQKMRFNNSFNYKICIDDQLDRKALTIPPMLIQPFIENAVEHGVRSLKDGSGKITVSFILVENSLIISVADNGMGISNTQNEKRKEHVSYATQITRERIAAIHKMYRKVISFEISGLNDVNNPQGTLVKFIFPFELIKQEAGQ